MADEPLTSTGFPIMLMQMSFTRMKQAIEGLTDEQLSFQPDPASNSIGWLVWHLSRWKDIQTARVAGEAEVWISDGWAGRFGLPGDRNGNGDTPEQVAAFRAERGLLEGYAEAAHDAALRRMRAATPEQLTRTVSSPGRPDRPAYRSLLINAIDYTEHTGQIAYLRGMLTGPGWLPG